MVHQRPGPRTLEIIILVCSEQVSLEKNIKLLKSGHVFFFLPPPPREIFVH